MDGARDALAMRLVRSTYFFRDIYHDGGASFGTNHDSEVLGRGDNREVGPIRAEFLYGLGDPFGSVRSRVNPEAG